MEHATKALLLTDVVDSTQLAARIGDAAMAALWATHDRIARDLLPAWQGLEIDKTDGMLLLFDTVPRATGYALALHAALAAAGLPFQARAGVHWGPVILRQNPAADVERGAKPLEVEGLAKPKAARIMGLARGGQVLLSAEAQAQLGPGAWVTGSLGHYQLKGLPEPEEVFEAAPTGQRLQPPPDGDKAHRVLRRGDWWLPVRDIPHHLPHTGTEFIGRQAELQQVADALQRARLVTLLGMGGLGKTRLALQSAAELLPRFPDGAWFVDLSALTDARLVPAELARVLGVNEEPGRTLTQTLCEHLRTRCALLVLDNCEHLVEAVASLAQALVQQAPQVRLLATSREALRLAAEAVCPVLPMAVPDPEAPLPDLSALGALPAVQLFVGRAQAHKPGFVLDERQAPAVAALVARLEGIPLALELAAARVRSLPVADILARLDKRFALLTGGARQAQVRQQTLRGLVDWSFELLTDRERRLFARLGAFAGGFDLAAAEAVGGLPPLEPFAVLDLLASLVEKSLVMLDDSAEPPRYRMLETLVDYARDKLGTEGDAADVALAHLQHYFALAKAAHRGLQTPEQPQWLARMETELGNLRAANALAAGGTVDPLLAVKLPVAMQGFWILRGRASEGRRTVATALGLPGVQASPVGHAHALYVAAALATSQADHAEARRLLETCLALRRGLQSPLDLAATLSTLALALLQAGEPEAAARHEQEALALFRHLKHTTGEAIGLLHLGHIAIHQGQDDDALASLRQALQLCEAIPYPEGQAECEQALGELALLAGQEEDAREHFERSLKVSDASGDARAAVLAQAWLGRAALAAEQLAEARQHLGQALQALRRFEMRDELVACLEDHAWLAQREGRTLRATELAATVERLREQLALRRSPRQAARWGALLQALQQRLPEADYTAAWRTGSAWALDTALAHC